MNTLLSPNVVQPNRPLRKPASSPGTPSYASLPGRIATMPGSAPRSSGGPVCTPVSMGVSASLGTFSPTLTVFFCNYCGQRGNFRCKRCKKTAYCSVGCQTEDWKAHRHLCKSAEPEDGQQKQNGSLEITNGTDVAQLKVKTSPIRHKVHLKDLEATKLIKGAEIQAIVAEFYNPGRFFLLPEIPEVREALRNITTELQKTYSVPTGTAYVPCAGEVCAVQFSCDLNWYRGLVQSLTADQKTASVLYIDYGNEENVMVSRIRPLSADIKPYGPCTIECQVAGVLPVVGSWSAECCMTVRQLLCGKTLTLKLVDTSEDGRVHAVDVQLSKGQQLSAFLLDHGYALEEAVSSPKTDKEISDLMKASVENFKRCSEGKDDNSWAQPPEPLTQAIGDKLFVVVTHFQSPSDFIVQKVENAGVIQDLQLKLREHCSQVVSPQNFRPAPGTVCCAQFSEDKQWYRAKILAYSSEERVCVGYLDFGNSEDVDLNQLRPISQALLEPPMQAVPCSLAGVQPVGESWSEDCLLASQRLMSNRIMHIEIQSALEGKAVVVMVDESSDPQINVAELLIAADYAAAAAPASPQAAQQNKEKGSSTDPPAPPAVNEPLIFSSVDLPSDGQTVVLLASVVESPEEFYCRVNNPSDHQVLMELSIQLKQHCESDKTPYTPKVGEPCCVKFEGDGGWYRALVKELLEDKAEVNFVDFGHTMIVERSHLHSITPQLLKLPFQTVRCWLAGVEPAGSEWSSEALLWFQNVVDGEQLSARVVSVTDQGYGVELESRGLSVAAAMASHQLAKRPGDAQTAVSPASPKLENQSCSQAVSQIQAASVETESKDQAAVPLEVATFTTTWKTAELPLNETFQPCVAAIVNPALFYILSPTQVDPQKLRDVMVDLATYGNNNQAASPASANSRPVPGSACCARFSVDKKWYRAVVLEVGEEDLSVIYADYGNSEKVPISHVLPIPERLLELPFRIIRCSLVGKEHFPTRWSQEIQQMFKAELVTSVIMATVQAYDGSSNMLSLSLPMERGGVTLTAMIIQMLHPPAISSSPADSAAGSNHRNADKEASAAIEPVGPQVEPAAPSQNMLGNVTSPTKSVVVNKPLPPASQTVEQEEKVCPVIPKDPQTTSCSCCQSLKGQIDTLERISERMEKIMQMLIDHRAAEKGNKI